MNFGIRFSSSKDAVSHKRSLPMFIPYFNKIMGGGGIYALIQKKFTTVFLNILPFHGIHYEFRIILSETRLWHILI